MITAVADRWRVFAALLLWSQSVLAVGCSQQLDPTEYGQILNKMPEIKGADAPFPLPELEDLEPKDGEVAE